MSSTPELPVSAGGDGGSADSSAHDTLIIMNTKWQGTGLAVVFLLLTAARGYTQAEAPSATDGPRVTLKGSMVCNGASIPDPKDADHVMVLFAIDGTREIRA